jgi:AcrR family transcriptional regulator
MIDRGRTRGSMFPGTHMTKKKKKPAPAKVRTPRQKRSIERKRLLMDTAFRLFSERGVHATTSNRIAAEAGIPIGSFYSYFRDKKALLLEVLGEYLERFMLTMMPPGEPVDAAVPPGDVPAVVRRYLERMFTAFDLAPDFHRETMLLKYTDPDIRRIYDEYEKREIAVIIGLLEMNARRLKPRDIPAAAKVIHAAAENAGHSLCFLDYPMARERIIRELTKLISGYLAGR